MQYADLHHHVIYGVDDGPQTFEDAQNMLRRAHENGITDIAATSHATPGRHRFPMDTYLEHLRREQAWADEQGLGIRLHTGCEILYTDETARLLQSGEIPTIAGTRLVLVEFLGYLPRVLTDWSVTSVLAALYIMPIFALAVEHGKFHFAPLDLLGKASYDIFLLQILYHSFWVEHIYALIPQRPLQLLVNILICCAVGIAFHFIETPITRKLQRWAVSLLKST